jgi:hypothetical protein
MHDTGVCEAFPHTLTTRQAIAKKNVQKPADKDPPIWKSKCVGNEIESGANSHRYQAVNELRREPLTNGREGFAHVLYWIATIQASGLTIAYPPRGNADRNHVGLHRLSLAHWKAERNFRFRQAVLRFHC